VDRTTGQLKASAVQLTYPHAGSRTWTDGHTGEVFDLFNEVILGSANRIAAAYHTTRIHIFHNTSQLNAAWRQTFADGKVRGGELARRPEMMEYYENSIWKKNAITVAGGNGPGGGINQIHDPHALFLDNDQTIYIADINNDRIVEWKSGAGCGRIIAGGNGQLHHPNDVIVDKARNSVFICEPLSRRVSRWSLRNTYTRETIISGIACNGLTMDEQGFLYVSDFERYDVRRWQVGETHGIVVAGGNGAGNRLDQFNVPRKIFVDRDHSVYVADVHNDRVMKWVKGAKEGIVVAGGRGRGNSLSQLSFPEAIIVDQLGALYIADRYNHRIMRWLKGNTEGHIFVGEGGAGSLPNQLYHPHGLSFDLHGNLYVADGWNNRIQKFEIQ
ncbi:unnamed protein product, partial [Rotaria magnacalcarata]